MKPFHLFGFLFLFLFGITSCTKNGSERIAIQLSPASDSILKDTTSINVIYDSLKREFYSAKTDSAQLSILIDLSGKNKKITLPLVTDAIAYSQKTNNNYGLAEALLQKGNYFIHQSEFDSAGYYLNKSKSLAKESGSSKLLSKIYFYFGEFYYEQDENDTALTEYENSLKIAQGIQDKKMTAYALSGIAEAYRMTDENEKSTEYFNRALNLTKQINDKSRTAFCLSSLGEIARLQGDNKKAIGYYSDAQKLAEAIKDKSLIAFCLSSRASVYVATSDYEKALSDFDSALKIAREINSNARITFCLSSIGEIYRMQNDYAKALDYFNQALTISEKINDKARIAFCYSSIGELYRTLENSSTALINLNHALMIAREIDDKSRIAFCYNTLGETYLTLGDSAAKSGNIILSKKYYTLAIPKLDTAINVSLEYGDKVRIADCLSSKGETYSRNVKSKQDPSFQKAIDAFSQSLQLADSIGNWNRITLTLSSMGSLYLQVNDPSSAKTYAQKSLTAAKKSDAAANVLASATVLYQAYEKTGDYKNALEMHKLFKQMSDSLTNADNIKRFAATEYKAKEEKLNDEKTKQEVVFKAEQVKQDAEIRRQRAVRNTFIIGFALVLILAFVIFRSLQQNRKARKIIEVQKAETEHQKILIEEKNKEIIDSITYAKRLQQAILPPLSLINKHLPQSFLLYKPKDIVAGDFYWMEIMNPTIGNLSDEPEIFIAVADCTGHGVPGAMVSVVCSNALNRAVKEFSLRDPGKILDKVRELVVETFVRKDFIGDRPESAVQDGMDISLCSIRRSGTNEKIEVSWSGANNPLWYMQSGVMKEIKADKQPIGKTDHEKPFTTHTLQFEKGDLIYLFTDGYADQFGGPQGKKFKYKQLLELIKDHAEKTMPLQNEALSGSFTTWKGELEQIDDVCIIGLRL